MMKIETDRLVLRDYQPGDLHDMHRLWSDRAAMYYLDDIATDTIEETAASLEASMANADGRYFCICDKDGRFMGGVGYTITDVAPPGKVVHMGYMLLPEYQGHGFMTEAVRVAIDFAFGRDGCIRITTGCHAENEASWRVMEKVGFRREGERIASVYHDGKMKDRWEYAMNKGDTSLEYVSPY